MKTPDQIATEFIEKSSLQYSKPLNFDSHLPIKYLVN